ncbi:PmeII family type II restriction endonuclease [Methanospirillum sp.]
MTSSKNFYSILKSDVSVFNPDEIKKLFSQVDEERVTSIANRVGAYLLTNLPNAFNKREGISDYRTNPYVLMTSASVLNFDDPERLANFLFNSKFYMALETSFGKSIESVFIDHYPINTDFKWEDPKEKIREFAELSSLSREEKAQKRLNSVWREIDKSTEYNGKRYLLTIKSGPNTINDTQVQGMTKAIIDNYKNWYYSSFSQNMNIDGIDIVIGLTYGTDKTTNNKENQILAKLLDNGFIEEDRNNLPGVLIDEESRKVRVYRKIGRHFWSFVGNPENPEMNKFVFLEILLGLSKALSHGIKEGNIETKVNLKMVQLSEALKKIQFNNNNLPSWISKEFSADELFWFSTTMSAFFDEGI